MTRILLIDIPAPCKFLNSNDRSHRMAAANLTRQWRTAARVAAGVGVHEPFTGKVHITAKVWKQRGGRFDVCNLYPTFKACIDGIVDSGVLIDDSNEYVIGPDMRVGGKGEPRVILTIQETNE